MDKPYTCQMCGQENNSQEELDTHNEKVHGMKKPMESGAMMKCPMCGMEFATQEEMDEHMKEAHGKM